MDGIIDKQRLVLKTTGCFPISRTLGCVCSRIYVHTTERTDGQRSDWSKVLWRIRARCPAFQNRRNRKYHICLLYLDKRIVLQILNGRVSEELNWVIGWYQDSLSLNKYPVSKRIVLTCYNLCHMRLIRWYCLGACKAENCVFWCVFW